MKVEIRKYEQHKDYEGLLAMIRLEGQEWKEYFNPKYQLVLKNSLTYVALSDQKICGYSRSIDDSGLYIWVIDLLVDKEYRGNLIGKKLMERLHSDFPDQDVFVLSDVDEYYQKLGYSKEGSVFRVGKTQAKK